jgi:hypothetical protein
LESITSRVLGFGLCNSDLNSSMAAPAAAAAAAGGQALTLRALAAGLLVGSVLCFSNMYFGLQTGWVTMGSLQSAILGEAWDARLWLDGARALLFLCLNQCSSNNAPAEQHALALIH